MMKEEPLSLRQKYLKILSGLAPAGAIGVSLALGSAMPAAASQEPAGVRPAAQNERVSERLAAIREAVSLIAPAEAAAKPLEQRAQFLNVGRHGFGFGLPWSNGWNNWQNWNNWHNRWHNWGNGWSNW
jgi:hypothetical protein